MQIGQGITDGNQIAALTLHGLFSHVPQIRQGVGLPAIPGKT